MVIVSIRNIIQINGSDGVSISDIIQINRSEGGFQGHNSDLIINQGHNSDYGSEQASIMYIILINGSEGA